MIIRWITICHLMYDFVIVLSLFLFFPEKRERTVQKVFFYQKSTNILNKIRRNLILIIVKFRYNIQIIFQNPFIYTYIYLSIYQKRFYTRGTLRSIRISRLAKIQPFIVIGWYPWSKKRVDNLRWIKGKGVVKTFTVVNKMPYYILIYYKTPFYLSICLSIYLSYPR